MVASLCQAADENRAIWVFLEQANGSLEAGSLALLARGRELPEECGWPLAGLLLGFEVADLAQLAIAYGADQVYDVEHPLLRDFTMDAYLEATFQALLGATLDGRDLAGRLAVRLRTGLNADCTGLRLDSRSGVLVSEVPASAAAC